MNEEQKYIDFETITVRKTQESKLVGFIRHFE